MTEPQVPPLRRPANVRPRSDSPDDIPAPSGDELSAVELQLARLPAFSGATVIEDPELGVVVGHGGRGPGQNFVAAIRWPDEAVASRLATLNERMRRAGEWPAVLIAEGVTRPPDLESVLAAAGWMEVESERMMWTRRPPVVPHLDPSTRLEAATRRSAGEYERLEREVFGLPDSQAAERTERLADAVDAGRLRAFLVRLHGDPVAVARLAMGDTVAGIYGVGVTRPRRRQGFGALVTAIATRSGLATGNRLVWLSVSETNEAALALYRSLGYRPGFRWTRWLAPRG